MPQPHRLAYPIGLLAIALAGLTLRLFAARGGLWLDEAWSASFARDVGTPLGVFVSIHHDNNHHLNTLWMQRVGLDAPPMLQRGLSVACGTVAVLVSAAIARPRGVAAALVTAALFAVSPILVTYGSEARGYAPMVLALLTLVWLADRWTADPPRPAPVIGAVVLCVLGLLSQMTMAFGVLATGGWLMVAAGPRRAAPLVAAMFGSVAVTLAAILWWLPGPGGFTLGAYQPFGIHDLADGVRDMVAFTIGVPRARIVIAALPLLVLLGWRLGRSKLAFHASALIGLPAGIALLQVGNAGMARYYLTASIALLLLGGEIVGTARGRWRWVAGSVLALVLAGSLAGDLALIRDRRADPARAVDAILAGGSAVTLDRARAAPVIAAAAAVRGRDVRIVPCAPWLFVDRDGTEPFPDRPRACGVTYVPVAGASPSGLSGTHWRLYHRDRRCAGNRPAA